MINKEQWNADMDRMQQKLMEIEMKQTFDICAISVCAVHDRAHELTAEDPETRYFIKDSLRMMILELTEVMDKL